MSHEPMSQPIDVADLAKLSIDSLRGIWRAQLETAPPASRAPEFVRRELAWRLEARVHGDTISRYLLIVKNGV